MQLASEVSRLRFLFVEAKKERWNIQGLLLQVERESRFSAG